MAAGRLLLPSWMPALDSNGAPIPNARVFFYLNLTTTLAPVYADEGLSIPLANPVDANASGRFPAVWADGDALYSASVEAPYGPAGVPFTYDNLSASLGADILIAGAAEIAANEAVASAAAAEAALAEIQDIAANAPDAPSVVNKANKSLDNVLTADFGAKAIIPSGGDTEIPLSEWRGLMVPPEAFGAVSGIYNDVIGAANIVALNKAVAAGVIIDGGGRSYAISGRWTPTHAPKMRNLSFVQVATTGIDRATTIFISGKTGVRIENVTLDLNNIQAPAGTTMNSAQGIFIYQCLDIDVRGTKVVNGGAHSGLWVEQCQRGAVVDCAAEDFIAEMASEPTDEVCQGVVIINCQDMQGSRCGGYNLTANWPGRPAVWERKSRGFVLGSDNVRFSYDNCYGHLVGEGVDVTGSNNRYGTVTNSQAYFCTLWGIKAANRTQYVTIRGGVVYAAERGGVVMNSASAATGLLPQYCDIEGIIVINTGAGGLFSAAEGRMAFSIISQTGGPAGYPGGIRYINCLSIDDQVAPTTDYGFANRNFTEQAPNSTIPPNELINCRSVGHISGFQTGFNFPIAKGGGTTNQVLANSGTAEKIIWTVDLEDSSNLIDLTNGRYYAKVRGRYLVRSMLQFDGSSAIGRREVHFYRNGSETNTRDRGQLNATSTGEPIRVLAITTMTLDRQDYVEIYGYHNSGGALSVDRSLSYCEIIKIADA